LPHLASKKQERCSNRSLKFHFPPLKLLQQVTISANLQRISAI
jgi:hypothetical protein